MKISSGCTIDGVVGLGRFCEIDKFYFSGKNKVLIRGYKRIDSGKSIIDQLKFVLIIPQHRVCDIQGVVKDWVSKEISPEVLILI